MKQITPYFPMFQKKNPEIQIIELNLPILNIHSNVKDCQFKTLMWGTSDLKDSQFANSCLVQSLHFRTKTLTRREEIKRPES